ncbi:hypothetical protein [Enterovirga sp.]|uniref:hypothetical protein n=1 Tax=Enterovirga sp. TaxID=2026350 RepID=UPI002D038FEA|nr:hypothetical protein [Enterovirga sp.]HMO27950.1 hypothetical protein [Enterovirga sp.]
MPRSAMLLGAMVVGAALLAPPEVAGEFGLAPAGAASQKGRAGAVRGKRPAAGRASAARRVRFTEKKGFMAKARYASLPKFKPRVVMPAVAAPKAASAEAPQPDHVAEPKSDPASLPLDRVIATASITPAPAVDPGMERMRPALEARARAMALDLGNLSLSPPEAAPPVQLAARSVTFDLQKGVRTIVFDDGATVTAPFDKERASGLTGLKPASP